VQGALITAAPMETDVIPVYIGAHPPGWAVVVVEPVTQPTVWQDNLFNKLPVLCGDLKSIKISKPWVLTKSPTAEAVVVTVNALDTAGSFELGSVLGSVAARPVTGSMAAPVIAALGKSINALNTLRETWVNTAAFDAGSVPS